nr:prolyl endopeptidase-like isoform X2 [Tanacetum cinerariifolium]
MFQHTQYLHVKFSGISRTNDRKCFFFSRYPALKECENLDAGTETNANLDNKLYYHFLGTDQYEDILCWENPDNTQLTLRASIAEDGKEVEVMAGQIQEMFSQYPS